MTINLHTANCNKQFGRQRHQTDLKNPRNNSLLPIKTPTK